VPRRPPIKAGHRLGIAVVTDDRALAFIQRHLKSVWALELLLFFYNNPQRDWPSDALVRELRGSEVVVKEALIQLKAARLVDETSERTFRYAPRDSSLGEVVSEVAGMYSTRPVAVIKAISGSPSEKLKTFSDAFKIRNT
jgi:hypothetical protein